MKAAGIALLLLLLTGTASFSQERIQTDTIPVKQPETRQVNTPRRVTIYSAVLPGLGQVYNKKAWKVPIIYGGFFGLGVAVRYNQQRYIRYKKAYIAVTDNDPSTNTPLDLLGSDVLKSERDAFKKSRDLAIIGCVALYALQIVDANVDAHLMEFDIDDNLSLRVVPETQMLYNRSLAPGLHISLRF